VRLELLGVRGSTCAPGAEFIRYGGHTSCIAVRRDAAALPTLVLDAGTGLRSLTALLGGASYDGSILLSHLHWDHMQGLPFFTAGDRDDARVDLYLPAQGGRSGRDLLAQSFSPPAFPITPEGLKGRWTEHALEAGSHQIEGFAVQAVDVVHKGGRTYGYRVSDEAGSVAYLPDHAPEAGMSDELLAMLDGVDVLVHDAQFLERERRIAVDYGHATVEDCVQLAEKVRAGTLVLFHHSPVRTDDALDELGESAQELGGSRPVVVARQGATLDVGTPVPLAEPSSA
jgi:phosphoribosyl 1,2-cyclic phosphodiesterase